jgi:hypothetical protein
MRACSPGKSRSHSGSNLKPAKDKSTERIDSIVALPARDRCGLRRAPASPASTWAQCWVAAARGCELAMLSELLPAAEAGLVEAGV